MIIKRKTTEKLTSFVASLRVYADGAAMTGHSGTPDPAASLHRFPIGEGELHALADVNTKLGDQIVPQLTIKVPGFGDLVIAPSEVHRMLVMIEEAQLKARNPGTYVGRESAVNVTV